MDRQLDGQVNMNIRVNSDKSAPGSGKARLKKQEK